MDLKAKVSRLIELKEGKFINAALIESLEICSSKNNKDEEYWFVVFTMTGGNDCKYPDGMREHYSESFDTLEKTKEWLDNCLFSTSCDGKIFI
ncbi:MAG: hypothetical protein ACYCTB_05675 [bacterium]